MRTVIKKGMVISEECGKKRTVNYNRKSVGKGRNKDCKVVQM